MPEICIPLKTATEILRAIQEDRYEIQGLRAEAGDGPSGSDTWYFFHVEGGNPEMCVKKLQQHLGNNRAFWQKYDDRGRILNNHWHGSIRYYENDDRSQNHIYSEVVLQEDSIFLRFHKLRRPQIYTQERKR